MKMLQLVDITPHMLYTEYKAKVEFTSIINACVSHELRNPLNSIMAKNIEKSALYEELDGLLDSFPPDLKKRQNFKNCKNIIDHLNDSKKT